MRTPAAMPSLLHGRIVGSAFRPHPLLQLPHLQTLATMLRPSPRVAFRYERRELPDGDFVDLGWCGDGNAGPLVLLLHGLTGGFESKYARGLARELVRRGWRCVLLQFRGAGAEPNRLPRYYHHGETEDLRELVAELRRRERGAPLYAVGWSLGGNVLLKHLGESGEGAGLTAAVAVCPPFSLAECAERLAGGFSRVYQWRMLSDLKTALMRKFERVDVPRGLDLNAALRSRTFAEFDDAATAPLHGFADAADYYRRSACGQYLRGIAVPTLVIHAQDDPFMTPAIVPEAAQLSPRVTLELSARGGHVGFIPAGLGGAPRFWLEPRIADHLQAQHRAT